MEHLVTTWKTPIYFQACNSASAEAAKAKVLYYKRFNATTHDMTRIMKATTAFIENDARGCYDRLVNNLILLLLARLGFAQCIALFVFGQWLKCIQITIVSLW